MSGKTLCILILSLLLPAAPAAAQNQFDLSNLAPGQLLLNLSASEETEVDQDTLMATLQYTAQGRDRTALQEEVNEAMSQALDLLEGAEEVEYSTQQYHVYMVQPRRNSRDEVDNPVWRAQQSVQLISKDSGELLALTGQLQGAGLHLTSLNYTLSQEQYAATADDLMAAALESLQFRAQEAAHALEKAQAELIEVSIDGNRNFPGPMMRGGVAAMAEDSAQAPPVAEPGKTRVSVTVSARALLSP